MERGKERKDTWDVTHFIAGVQWPATKKQLIEQARVNNASEEDMRLLEEMEDKEYVNQADFAKGYGRAHIREYG